MKQATNKLNNPDIVADGEATQWKPGQSGNPNGRPEGSITTLLREKDRRKVADKLYQLAIAGNLQAIQEYINRTEGKVVDKTEHSGHILVTTPDMLELATRRQIEASQEEILLIEEHKQ